jgi:serine protease Do
MRPRMSNRTRPRRPQWLVRSGLTLFFFILVGFGRTPVTYASGVPGGNIADPVVRAVDIAKPAVVRIFTQFNAQLTIHFSSAQSVTFPQASSSGYAVTVSGTGTIISAHGDILTADHVINPPHDQQLSQFLDMQAAPDIANYINQNLKQNPQVTSNQVNQELTSGQLPSDPNFGTPVSQVFLSTDYTGPLTATSLNNVPAQFQALVDRVEAQSSVNQADLAIVHANLNDTASIELGDSSNVQQQDMLTIIGFPGNGDVSNLPTNLLTSSVNQISVSSIKTTDQGAQVIQVGGNVEHGDSGGPALDSNGNVVGIVSFGLSSPDSPGSTEFLQASNSARNLVQSIHLNTTPGPFEKAWAQAFTDYAATTPGHWHKAEQELAALQNSYPQFKAILPYLQYAQAQAKQEKVQQPASTSTVVPTAVPASKPTQASAAISSPLSLGIIIGVVVIVLALLALLFFTLQRRRNRSTFIPSVPPLSPIPSPLPGQNRPMLPSQGKQQPQQVDSMAAFGAPPTTLHSGQQMPMQPSNSVSGAPIATASASGGLRPWPCGHMNRPNARYCTICGEPAPPPTIRRVEQ